MLLAEIPYHGWDPVLLDLPGPIDIRWYGLMYVVGFLVAGVILGRLSDRGFLPLTRDRSQDVILWMVFGVLLGGRIGYVVFYKPGFLSDPISLLKIWEGGMSFHGGLIGVCVAFLLFARRAKIAPSRLADSLALAVTPGIAAVRFANFVNGELYGRVTDASVPWAMRFPTDPVGRDLLGIEALRAPRDRELKLMEALQPGGRWEEVASQVPLRHPSQVYEMLGEGVLLGLVLWLVYRLTRGQWGNGRFAGLFLLGYGAARFGIEFFRQPDTQFKNEGDELGTVLGPFSMGQVLCSVMIVIGAFLVFRRSERPPLEPPPAEESQAAAA